MQSLSIIHGVTAKQVEETTLRVVKTRMRIGASDPSGKLMYNWRHEAKFWAVRQTLFKAVTNLDFGVVIQSLQEKGAKGNDPNDKRGAEIRALKDKETALRQNLSFTAVVAENWHRWMFFPDIVREEFGVTSKDVETMVARFDAELAERVLLEEPKIRALMEKDKAAQEEKLQRDREQYERRQILERTPPNIFRARVDQFEEMRRRHLVKLVFELTDSDLRGHEELKLPMLSGFWDIFKPWAIKGGISSDLETGRFDVLIHQSLLFDLHESSESLSEQVRQVLALNAQRTGLISGTKAASILKMKREDFRKVVEVGEISPRKTIEISSGPKKGIEFDGYAPKDVIELKERLLAATFL